MRYYAPIVQLLSRGVSGKKTMMEIGTAPTAAVSSRNMIYSRWGMVIVVYACLSDDYPFGGRCPDCGLPVSGAVTGYVSDSGEFSVYVHTCEQCGHKFLRILRKCGKIGETDT